MYKIIIEVLLDYVGFNHCSNGRSVWKTWVSHWIPSYSCHSNNICALLFFFKVGLSEIVESEQYEHELYPLDTSGTSLCPGWSDHVVGVGVEVEVRLLHNIVRSSCWGEFVQLSSYSWAARCVILFKIECPDSQNLEKKTHVRSSLTFGMNRCCGVSVSLNLLIKILKNVSLYSKNGQKGRHLLQFWFEVHLCLSLLFLITGFYFFPVVCVLLFVWYFQRGL